VESDDGKHPLDLAKAELEAATTRNGQRYDCTVPTGTETRWNINVVPGEEGPPRDTPVQQQAPQDRCKACGWCPPDDDNKLSVTSEGVMLCGACARVLSAERDYHRESAGRLADARKEMVQVKAEREKYKAEAADLAERLKITSEAYTSQIFTNAKLIDERDRYKAVVSERCRELDRWREREAAVCPEDVGFDEYIKALIENRDKLSIRVTEAEQKVAELMAERNELTERLAKAGRMS
jgi:hypothetical protein